MVIQLTASIQQELKIVVDPDIGTSGMTKVLKGA
jgi:hypothetical protein